MTAVTLTSPPPPAASLALGVLRSPFRRPAPDADFPRVRLVLPGLRADPARLAAYERACGFAAGGHGTLPVTYPHVLGFPLALRLMSGRDFPLPLLGLVHTSVDITRHAALPAGGTYELAVHVAGLAPHRRGTEATVVTSVRAEGEVAWESRSTYLARHRTGGGESAGASGATSGAPTAPPEGPAALPVRGEWRLGAGVGRRYASVSGDRNPIHLHPAGARLFGFRHPIAHGMWTVARCLAAHGTPERATVGARFRAPVPLPGTVVYGADGTGRFELRDPRGRVHVTGEIGP